MHSLKMEVVAALASTKRQVLTQKGMDLSMDVRGRRWPKYGVCVCSTPST